MKQNLAAMIDIESLDTTPTSVVLSVGACKFDPYSDVEPYDHMHWRLNVDAQLEAGRTTSEDTLTWWSTQPEEVQNEALGPENRIEIPVFFAQINRWLTAVDSIWCQGPQFDMVILEDLCRQFRHHHNWAYWQIRDCRTLFKLMPTDPRRDVKQEHAHNAMWDAHYQAQAVQKVYRDLGIKL